MKFIYPAKQTDNEKQKHLDIKKEYIFLQIDLVRLCELLFLCNRKKCINQKKI